MVLSAAAIGVMRNLALVGVLGGLGIVAAHRVNHLRRQFLVGGLALAALSLFAAACLYLGATERIVAHSDGGHITAERRLEIGLPYRAFGHDTVITNESPAPLRIQRVWYGLVSPEHPPPEPTIGPHTTLRTDVEIDNVGPSDPPPSTIDGDIRGACRVWLTWSEPVDPRWRGRPSGR